MSDSDHSRVDPPPVPPPALPSVPTGDEPPLTVTDFVPESPPIPPPPPPTVSPRKPPGPGLPESVGWTVGVFAAHGVAFACVAVVVIVLHVLSGGKIDELSRPEHWEQQSRTMLMAAGEQGLVLLITLAAVTLRLGGRVGRLGLTPIPMPHLGIIACGMLPLSLLCSALYYHAMQVWTQLTESALWQRLLELFPLLHGFDQTQTMKLVQALAQDTPLVVLVLVIAVAPALGEELVFRGLIGRGLIARWGLVGGVLITSVLFGMAHVHPAHALAVIPLGIVLHLAYLATRSFWAPVLLHFLNNAWAAVAATMVTQEELAAMADEHPTPPLALLAASVCVIVLGTLLWRTRVRYFLPDGSVWNPGYLTAEPPPPHLAAEPHRRPIDWPLAIAAGLSLFLLFAAMIATQSPV